MPRESDYIQQIANYFKKNLAKGYTIESLRWALVEQGYSRSAVLRAIDLANEQLAKSAPKIKEKPVIRYEIGDANDIIESIKKQQKSFWQKIKNFFLG